jgi:hypothetical protein
MFSFRCKTIFYQNLNQICNILNLEQLIYGLYVCTCLFLLHQEPFDMILDNSPSFYIGSITASIRAMSKLSAC